MPLQRIRLGARWISIQPIPVRLLEAAHALARRAGVADGFDHELVFAAGCCSPGVQVAALTLDEREIVCDAIVALSLDDETLSVQETSS